VLGLIYKDFVSNKLMTYFTALLFIVWGLMAWQGATASSVFLISMVLMYTFSSLIPDSALTEDIKSKWNIYALTLPIGAKKIVLAKYLVMLMIFLVCFLFSVVLVLLSSIKYDFFEFNIFLPLTIFGFITAFESISMAFVFRFGRRKGGIFKAVFVLLLPFAGLMYLLFGDLYVFGEEALFSVFDWFILFDFTVFAKQTWWGFLIAAVICFIGGCIVSGKIYRRGTEADNE